MVEAVLFWRQSFTLPIKNQHQKQPKSRTNSFVGLTSLQEDSVVSSLLGSRTLA